MGVEGGIGHLEDDQVVLEGGTKALLARFKKEPSLNEERVSLPLTNFAVDADLANDGPYFSHSMAYFEASMSARRTLQITRRTTLMLAPFILILRASNSWVRLSSLRPTPDLLGAGATSPNFHRVDEGVVVVSVEDQLVAVLQYHDGVAQLEGTGAGTLMLHSSAGLLLSTPTHCNFQRRSKCVAPCRCRQLLCHALVGDQTGTRLDAKCLDAAISKSASSKATSVIVMSSMEAGNPWRPPTGRHGPVLAWPLRMRRGKGRRTMHRPRLLAVPRPTDQLPVDVPRLPPALPQTRPNTLSLLSFFSW